MTDAYLSGPITIDPDHRARFAEAEELVRARGEKPVNPLEVPAACEDFSCLSRDDAAPHGKPKEGKHTWGCYMRGDVAALMHCDKLYLLRGWEKSPGATAEQFIARMVGIPVEELFA